MRLDRATAGSMCKAALSVVGAVALTPLLLFLSTTNTLFIMNAEDFVHDVHVLGQFLTYSVYAFLLGILFFLLARFLKPAILSLPFWLHVLAGPFVLVYAFLHARHPEVMDNSFVCGAFALIYLLLAGVLSRKGKLEVALAVFSRLFVVFFLIEACIFAANGESRRISSKDESELQPLKEAQSKRSNIYHVIFDSYGTDLFECAFTHELRSHLAGFQYFPDTIAAYSGTYVSVPSLFCGDYYSPPASPKEYMNGAFDSEVSFLHWLDAGGYDTYAFLPSGSPEGAKNAFRHVRFHRKYADLRFTIDGSAEFRNLWMYSYFPHSLVTRFVSEKSIEELKNPAGALPKAQPVYSYVSFQRFLREEESLPDRNRYTYIQLMIPHHPTVLRADGSFGPPLEDGTLPETSAMEQTHCAANMIMQFTDHLKKLGRFDDSLVLIHADHGNLGTSMPGQIKLIRLASPLLLLKLPGRGAAIPFEVCDAEAHLIDIAPTVLGAVGIQPEVSYAGISLMHPEKIPRNRKRRFGSYNAFVGKKWDPEAIHYYTVRGRRFTSEKSGTTLVEAFPPQDVERYFNGEESVSDITYGGFEEFPAGAKYPTGWGGLRPAPRCDREDEIVKFGKFSLKLTSTPGESNRPSTIGTLTAPPMEELRGKEVTFGMWVYTSQPDKVGIFVIDSGKRYFSAQPRTRKVNEWQLVIVRTVIPRDAEQVLFAISLIDDGKSPTVCYVDGAALVIDRDNV